MYLRTAAAGHVRRSLVLTETASERSARPSDAEYRAYVCTNASLSNDIFTMSPRSAKLRSFVPLLILIANEGPPETAGPFSCVVRADAREVVRRMAGLISARRAALIGRQKRTTSIEQIKAIGSGHLAVVFWKLARPYHSRRACLQEIRQSLWLDRPARKIHPMFSPKASTLDKDLVLGLVA